MFYIDNLPLIAKESDFLSYHDTETTLSEDDNYQLCENLLSELDVVNEWLKVKLLIFLLLFCPIYQITINDTKLIYSKKLYFS